MGKVGWIIFGSQDEEFGLDPLRGVEQSSISEL